MKQYPLPEWMKESFDQRINDLTRRASLLEEVQSMRQQQAEIEGQLKQEMDSAQFRLILDWEDALNFRSSTEKEWLYLEGFKDGLRFYKQLHDYMFGNAGEAPKPHK